MNEAFIAHAFMKINAPITKVWDALINPELIRRYMFGAEVVTDWKPGSPIIWKRYWEGEPYEDKGIVLQVETYKKLQYSYFSPLAGLLDVPENYQILTFEISNKKQYTLVSLSHDNNVNELARVHSQELWEVMLVGMKNVLEN